MSVYTDATQKTAEMQRFLHTVRGEIMKEAKVGVRKLAEQFLDDVKKQFKGAKNKVVSRIGKRTEAAQKLLSNEELKAGLDYLDLVEIVESKSGNAVYFTLLIPDKVQPGSKFSLVIISRSIEYGSKSLGINPAPHQRIVLSEFVRSLDEAADDLIKHVEDAINKELAKLQVS